MKSFMNVDVVDTLRNIVNIHTDRYKTDFNYDILELRNGSEGKYYSFMARDAGTWLFNEKDVYIKGTQANITWKNYENKASDVKTYFVEITSRKGNEVLGNIYEMDYVKSLKEIMNMEKDIDYVNVSFMSGDTYKVDLEVFNKTQSDLVRTHGKIIDFKYVAENESDLLQFIRKSHEQFKKYESISPDEYIYKLNRDKLSEQGYSKGDMIYVPTNDVIKLQANKIVVHSLDHENKVFGVKISDKGKLDVLDRGDRESFIKQYSLEQTKKEQLLEYGYTGNDMYVLSVKEIQRAMDREIPIYMLGKGEISETVMQIDELKPFIKQGGLIAIHSNSKEQFLAKLKKGISDRIKEVEQIKPILKPKNVTLHATER